MSTPDISLYAGQARELSKLVEGLSSEDAVRRPDESRWSIVEIAGHLADAELLASVRIRRILTQDRPRLSGYEQNVWADMLGYRNRKIRDVVERFVVLRKANAELVQNLENPFWEYFGQHDEYGVMTLRQWIEDYLSHTARHLDQIRGLLLDFDRQARHGKV